MDGMTTQDKLDGLDARSHAAYLVLKQQSTAVGSGTFHLSWNELALLGINDQSLAVLRDERLIDWTRDRNMSTIRLLDVPELVLQEEQVEVYVDRVPLESVFNIPGLLPTPGIVRG